MISWLFAAAAFFFGFGLGYRRGDRAGQQLGWEFGERYGLSAGWRQAWLKTHRPLLSAKTEDWNEQLDAD